MSTAEQRLQIVGRAKLRNSTTVFLVGNIEPTDVMDLNGHRLVFAQPMTAK